MALKTWTVIWRSGGTENFQWHRCLPVQWNEALEQSEDLQRQGYAVRIHDTAILDSIGLPETYDCRR